METEDWDHEVGSGDEGKVVPLRRDWFGPKEGEWFGSLDELVPVGVGAHDQESPEDLDGSAGEAQWVSSGSADPSHPAPGDSGDAEPPVRAEHFWDGLADVHDLIQFPDDASTSDARTGSVLGRRRLAWSRLAADVVMLACCLVGLSQLIGHGRPRTAGRVQQVAGIRAGTVDRLDRPSRVHVSERVSTSHRVTARRTPSLRHHAVVGHPPSARNGSGSAPATTTSVQQVAYSPPAQATQPASTLASNGGGTTGGYAGPSSGSGAGTSGSGGGGSSTGAAASQPGPTGPGAPFGPGHMGG